MRPSLDYQQPLCTFRFRGWSLSDKQTLLFNGSHPRQNPMMFDGAELNYMTE